MGSDTLFNICVFGSPYFKKHIAICLEEELNAANSNKYELLNKPLRLNVSQDNQDTLVSIINDDLATIGIYKHKISLLMVAVLYCDTEVVKYLLCEGARPLDEEEKQNMIYVCVENKDKIRLQVLTRFGDFVPNNNNLSYALLNNNTKMVLELIKEGAHIKNKDLLYALRYRRNRQVIYALIKYGNVHQLSYDGQTTLMMGVKLMEPCIVYELIKRKVDVHARDKHEYTAIIYAAKNANKEIVRMLLDYGANVYEALVTAQLYKRYDMLPFICRYFTAYRMAKRWRKKVLIKTLQKSNCNLLPNQILTSIADTVLNIRSPSMSPSI